MIKAFVMFAFLVPFSFFLGGSFSAIFCLLFCELFFCGDGFCFLCTFFSFFFFFFFFFLQSFFFLSFFACLLACSSISHSIQIAFADVPFAATQQTSPPYPQCRFSCGWRVLVELQAAFSPFLSSHVEQ